MAKLDFTIEGEKVESPLNYEELSVNVDFTNGGKQVSLNEFTWSGTGQKKLLDWVNAGKNGTGPGMLEGIPLSIEIGGKQISKGSLIPDRFYCDKISSEFRENKGIEWFNKSAQGLTFERLWNEGKITNQDTVGVPYVISEVPDTINALLIGFISFTMFNEIKDQIQSLIDYVGGLGTDPLQWGNITQIVLRVIYIALLVATFITQIMKIFNLLIQKVKYFKGMYVRDLCVIACKELDLDFKCKFLESGAYRDLFIIPQRYTQPQNEEGVFGIFTKDAPDHKGFYLGSLSQLLVEVNKFFGTKVDITNGVLTLDKTFGKTSDIPTLKGREFDYFTYNKKDFISNFTFEFLTDLNDKNTILDYKGVSVQYQSMPKVVGDKGNLDFSGVEVIPINFARGSIKKHLTVVEEAFLAFAKIIDVAMGALTKVVNSVIDVINGLLKLVKKIVKLLKKVGIKLKFDVEPVKKIKYTPLADLIGDRVGMLKVENDFLTTPKLVLLGANGRLVNSSAMDADVIFKKFHLEKLFDPTYNNHQQRKVIEIESLELCEEDFLKILKTQRVYDFATGTLGFVKNIFWDPVEEVATNIIYEMVDVWTRNILTKIIIPDGK